MRRFSYQKDQLGLLISRAPQSPLHRVLVFYPAGRRGLSAGADGYNRATYTARPGSEVTHSVQTELR